MALNTSGSALRPRKYCAYIAICFYTLPRLPARRCVLCLPSLAGGHCSGTRFTTSCSTYFHFPTSGSVESYLGYVAHTAGGHNQTCDGLRARKQENTLAASLSFSLGRLPAVHIPFTSPSQVSFGRHFSSRSSAGGYEGQDSICFACRVPEGRVWLGSNTS